jgi:hypothetical protein
MVAADAGQDLRDAHKPLEARQQFQTCAATTCPKVVQDDCTRWLEAIEAAVPSVVVTAKSDAAVDLVDVTVLVDGQPFATKLNGESLSLDPGAHVFHFEAKGGGSLDRRLSLLRASETSASLWCLRRPDRRHHRNLSRCLAVRHWPRPQPALALRGYLQLQRGAWASSASALAPSSGSWRSRREALQTASVPTLAVRLSWAQRSGATRSPQAVSRPRL